MELSIVGRIEYDCRPQTGSSIEGGGIHRTADVSASSRRGFGVSSHLAASDWTDRLNPGTGEAL